MKNWWFVGYLENVEGTSKIFESAVHLVYGFRPGWFLSTIFY